MKTLTKIALATVSLFSLAGGTAYADSILGPDFSISAAVALQSDYRFRGITQNDKDPSEQATLNISGPDGWYIGTWAAKTDWTAGPTTSPSFEADFYGGKHTDLWGTDLNTEVYYYSYPDYHLAPGAAKASYVELIGQLTHSFGPFSVAATYAYSPEFSLGGGDGNYVAGNLTVPVNDWLSLSGNVGHQWVKNAKALLRAATPPLPGDGDYTHYDIGATVTYKSISFDARYVGTDMNKATCSTVYMSTNNACSGGFVGTVTYNISSFPW